MKTSRPETIKILEADSSGGSNYFTRASSDIQITDFTFPKKIIKKIESYMKGSKAT